MLSYFFKKAISVNQAKALLWEWETEMQMRDSFYSVLYSVGGQMRANDAEFLDRIADMHNRNANNALMSLWNGGYNAYHDSGSYGFATLVNDETGEIVCRLNPCDMEEI